MVVGDKRCGVRIVESGLGYAYELVYNGEYILYALHIPL
jgi:hypothetical protein